jgi:hypothetical protein
MTRLGLLFGWAVMFSVLAGWLIVTSARFDEPAEAGMSTQAAALPADGDPGPPWC